MLRIKKAYRKRIISIRVRTIGEAKLLLLNLEIDLFFKLEHCIAVFLTKSRYDVPLFLCSSNTSTYPKVEIGYYYLGERELRI